MMKLHDKEPSNNGDLPEEGPWANAMTDVDDFSTHMTKLKQEQETSRTQRALNKIGVVESRGDEKKFEEDLAGLDATDALRILDFMNGTITGEKKGERLTHGYGVWGGAEINGHLSPAPEVQSVAIEETWDAIKTDIKDNRKRATLVYYMINHLHLFGDGNGRTSRAMYEVFNKQNFQIVGKDFFHSTDSLDEIGNGEEFSKRNNLKPNADVRKTMLDLVKKDLVQSSRLPSEMIEMNCYLNLPNGERPMPDVFLTDDAEENLSNSEKKVVRNAFFEKPIAITALGIMLKKKHTFRSVLMDYAKKENGIGEKYIKFDIEKKDKKNAEDTFWNWEADDYREFCNIVKEVQLQQARKMIDVFKHEDKYILPDGKTYADYLSGV